MPNTKDSLRFAVLGDTGTGDRPQYEVSAKLLSYQTTFPIEFVLLLGDNLYGGERTGDFARKFEKPYEPLLERGVKFYAALGNHDNPNQRFYKHFNMDGKRYYSFKPRDGVRIFSLDSNYMDKQQLEWLEKELRDSGSAWKIAFFHHPLYSSGERHGPDEDLRRVVEPLFVKYGVDVVFNGHEHFYERLKPRQGVHYFIAGGSAKLRKGDIAKTDQTEKGFDQDNTFMLCEINGDKLHFQAVTRAGKVVDQGTIAHRRENAGGASAGR